MNFRQSHYFWLLLSLLIASGVVATWNWKCRTVEASLYGIKLGMSSAQVKHRLQSRGQIEHNSHEHSISYESPTHARVDITFDENQAVKSISGFDGASISIGKTTFVTNDREGKGGDSIDSVRTALGKPNLELPEGILCYQVGGNELRIVGSENSIALVEIVRGRVKEGSAHETEKIVR